MPTDTKPRLTFYRILIFLLGALASYLLLLTGLSLGYIVFAYTAGAVVLLLLGFSLPGRGGRKSQETQYSRGWMSFSLGVLGFGLGALFFVHRLRFKGAADKLQLRIDTTNGAFLAGLMFLGFIMGFYVVRNWLKEEDEFVKSLTAVAGVAFLASILGLAQGGGQNNGQQPLSFMSAAFANYFLGFTFSAFVNLLVYGALTASYSASLSPSSRSLIYFLYGTDKAKKLDEYFLKNFESDLNYARAMLVTALGEFRNVVLRGYASRIEAKRRHLAADPQQPAPNFYRLISIEGDPADNNPPAGQPPPPPPAGQQVAQGGGQQPAQGGGGQQPAAPAGQAAGGAKLFNVKLEKITDEGGGVTPGMFRMGITIRMTDSLEYVVAPSKYKQPFPLRGSVAGLALTTRKTIVMGRDKSKTFRNEDGLSVTPGKIESDRGFEEVDYLSYVSVPVVSRLGIGQEFPVGIINVDTQLLAIPPAALGAETVKGTRVFVQAQLSRKDLLDYASDIYDEHDDAVGYLVKMKSVAVPLLELYLKCRAGEA
jgi:hypothetical protein